ncbi:DUF3616 domain-containing protein [Nostoc sp. PCC 7107]|uniref:DUF3616 domain-containing protein n=1 Tax=Nostoc sp. PCC 7107 TaxID=317936 RepID=UPI00029F048D|nr:DUF3616 domain-containing protein [Nostoc sp. PCC 7107]AFY41145.1 hypothetical protein Nos7107_0472 [Nostoc sp. PCC 7107]
MHNSQIIKQIILSFTESFREYRTDISGVILTPDRYLWLGSDETASLERLTLIEENKFAEHQQYKVADFLNLPASENEEIDIEGLAYTDYYLWLVGSHSYKRKKPKPDKSDQKNVSRLAKVEIESNRYILGRIPLIDGHLVASCQHPKDANLQLTSAKLEITKQGNLLMSALVSDPHLGGFIQAAIPGKDNGFDIEGLAIYQNRIFLGLRGPVLRGWAIVLEIELQNHSPGLMKLIPMGEGNKEYKKYFLWLNGLGIRDLCLDGEDLLILAGPTMDLDGPVQIYRWQNGVNPSENMLNYPQLVQEIPYGNRNDHAEGMTLFKDILGVPSLLVVYDSPADGRLIDDRSVTADIFPLS